MKPILENGKIRVAEGATGTVLEALLRESFASGSSHKDTITQGGARTVGARDLLFAPIQHPEVIRELHRRYIAAGASLIKTATFGANLVDIPKLDRQLSLHADPEAFCRELNRNAALLSSSCAEEFGRSGGVVRSVFTAGSIGPGSLLPSLGQADPETIRRAYTPQVYGLIEGGVDILLIETVQDILHCKTLLALVDEARSSCGRAVEVMVSATLTAAGTLLCSTDLEAFAEIIAPYEPLSIGLNCSGGPLELEPFAARLSELTELPVSIMPNAGLPVMQGGVTAWPMEPEAWAQAMLSTILKARIAIAGGCCGTTPEHIAALSKLVGDSPAQPTRSEKRGRRLALASLYKAHYAGYSPLIVDERANTQGSRTFKEAISSGTAEAAVHHIIGLAETGSAALDLAIARPGKDDTELYAGIIASASARVRQAFVIDTMSETVFERSLPLIAGKALMNSVNLEDEERAKRLLRLAKRYGAAVVLLAMDHTGPAKTPDEKIGVSRRLFSLARSAGLREEDIFFDACTFPVLSAGSESARATLDAVKKLKTLYPDSGTILGVGNVSYGLARKLRAPVTRFFFGRALDCGLDAAIINPKTAALALDAEELLLLENFFHKPDNNLLREYYEGKPENSEDESAAGDARGIDIRSLVLKGSKHRIAEPAIAEFLNALSMEGKIESVLAAMKEVADRFDKGKLSLPEVMLAAETAKALLASKADAGKKEARRSIVLATVKGDLHDIGKNMVSLVLEAGNIRVIDLGIDVCADAIIAKAEEHKADAVGVSGLLTRSLPEMQELARAMRNRGSAAALLCGGAAVSQDFVSGYLEPLFPGKVFYGKDPFEALELMDNLGGANTKNGAHAPGNAAPNEALAQATALVASASEASGVQTESALRRTTREPQTGKPQEKSAAFFSGTIALHELLEAVNFKRLIHTRLNYANFAEGFSRVEQAVELARSSNVRLAYTASVCACFAGPGTFLVFQSEGKTVSFPLPVSDRQKSIAPYFRDSGALFSCTLGMSATSLVHAVSERTMSDGVVLHALFAELAEAGAELVHGKLKAEARATGGKRYSFGFPGAPGVECNGALLEFLAASQIGLSAAPSGELVPEYSITAIVSFDTGARYIDA